MRSRIVSAIDDSDAGFDDEQRDDLSLWGSETGMGL
jgi:hypothetical protein